MSEVATRRHLGWLLLVAVGAVALAAAFGGDEVRLLGRYERSALAGGEYWRLLTAHLVHLGWGHLWPNLAALALIGGLFDDVLDGVDWLVLLVVATLAIDAGLWLFDPEVAWYVGLSGVLHGLLAGGAVASIHERRRVGWWLLAGLGAKLAFEQVAGPLPFTAAATGGSIIVEAHLYGAIGGLLAALALGVTRRRSRL